MAVKAGEHRVRAVSGQAGDCSRSVYSAGFHSGADRLLLQSLVVALGVSTGHVLVDPVALLLHDFRVCCDQQGRRRGGFR